MPASDFGIAYYALEWIIRLTMLASVPFRRTPEAARSWLLLIFVLPVPGALLYWAIGRPRFPGWRGERFRALAPFVAALRARLKEREGQAPPAPISLSIPALAEKLGALPAVGGNQVELIGDYDAAIERLIADIDAARRHVRLLVYIFADDAVGRRVIDALGRAVERGVSCHVLVDAVGSVRWLRRTLERLRAAGVETREALPFRPFRGWTRRDMRNHRKLFLIDGAIGFAGSQNIVAKDFKPGIVNRELVARVTGPAVAEMEALFLADWYMETETLLESAPAIPAPAGEAVAQLLPSGADYPLEGFETLLVWRVHEARERVTIVTPYFIPNEDLLGAMRTAAVRGVAVDLIVSAVADQRLVHLAQCSYYADLLRSGIRVHLFRDHLLHAKNVAIDGKVAIVGSSNVDIRSFQLNEEVSLLLLDGASVAALEAAQQGYLENSDTLDLATWRERPRLRKLGENIARLISPLL